jgi:surface antigen
MSLFDDKTLVAYVDGELDPREAWLVQVALEREPELRDKVRVMREASAVLRAAFDPIVREALPADLDELLNDPQPVSAIFRGRLPDFSSRWAPTAIAATFALTIGLGGGYWAGKINGASVGMPDPAREFAIATTDSAGVLQAALEKKLSGSELTWTDERSLASVTVEPIRTYRNEDATFCREYRETFTRPSLNDRTVYGLACRGESGRWDVQYYLVPGEGGAPLLSASN